MSDGRPIGVFDSGLGGLTVVHQLMNLLPHERIVYLGDSARYPYGNRSDETIKLFGRQDALFLTRRDVKMLVVACNTASAVALEDVRKQAPETPVIGVVSPGARAAVSRTAEKKVGVIGTHATVRTEAYTRAIHNLDAQIRVFGRACPLFVPLVEEGMLEHDVTRMTAQYYLYELVDTGIDCLILGCTHYPLLLEVIQATVGARIEVLDSAQWAAHEAHDIMRNLGLLAPDGNGGINKSAVFVTDTPARFEEQATRFLGRRLPSVEKVPLEELAP
jgi:glutamate racemase